MLSLSLRKGRSVSLFGSSPIVNYSFETSVVELEGFFVTSSIPLNAHLHLSMHFIRAMFQNEIFCGHYNVSAGIHVGNCIRIQRFECECIPELEVFGNASYILASGIHLSSYPKIHMLLNQLSNQWETCPTYMCMLSRSLLFRVTTLMGESLV